MFDAVTWSLITEPGDSLAGYIRKSLGVSESLELVKSGITARELLAKIPADPFRPENFLSTIDDGLECWRRRLIDADPIMALEQIHLLGGSYITEENAMWPLQLDDLGLSAPVGLWVVGELSLNLETIAVVGSRVASDYGLAMTQNLVNFAVSRNWLTVSGGALGIDAEASRTAIHSNGKTWVVMAGGLKNLYPKQNIGLFEEVKTNGALISEMPPSVSPSRWRFLQRNRLIAALGKATLVVEAGFRSGSINTANHANELERPVGAIPGRVDSVRSAGCHRLIREGRAELIASPSQLLELMGINAVEDQSVSGASSWEIRVLDALGQSVLPVEAVAKIAGMTLSDTKQTLCRLSNSNLVRCISEGWQKL